jgi:hypothetical protein
MFRGEERRSPGDRPAINVVDVHLAVEQRRQNPIFSDPIWTGRLISSLAARTAKSRTRAEVDPHQAHDQRDDG